jgi:hypothetical protein
VVSLTGPILFSIAIHLCEIHHIQAVTRVISSSRLLGLCFALMMGEDRCEIAQRASDWRLRTTNVSIDQGRVLSTLQEWCDWSLRTQAR